MPLWFLAELTYRCPLRCPYCSNPPEVTGMDGEAELDTATWKRVLDEARELGACQLGFSGGEPLARPDLEDLVRHARGLGFYTNLITSGIGLTAGRLGRLREAGLDHIQLSLQGASAAVADPLAGRTAHARKLKVARAIKDAGFPMVLNVVLHRHNIHQVRDIMELARELRADSLELASVQFDGWAWRNRSFLLPSRDEVARAEAEVNRFRSEHGDLRIFYVVPDWFEDRPKGCGGGWGKILMAITPDGVALPCHGARKLPLAFPNVRDASLRAIWERSAGFKAFRGESWMQEPCRGCPERSKDFGGCRCQAFLWTGDAAATDPVCGRSPERHRIDAVLAGARTDDFVYREAVGSSVASGSSDSSATGPGIPSGEFHRDPGASPPG